MVETGRYVVINIQRMASMIVRQKERIIGVGSAVILVMMASCSPSVKAVSPTLTTTSLGAETTQSTGAAQNSNSADFIPASASGPTNTPYPTQTQTLEGAAASPTAVLATSTVPAGTPTPDTRKTARYWAEWPIVPDVSERAKEIYQKGLALGNDPHSFTTIGDCQSQPNIFMGAYGTDHYFLDEKDAALEETIRQFKDSFNRDSITVKDGLSVASVFSPAWADQSVCQSGETPLDCEFRLHKPSIVFINLGTNWKGGDDVKHEEYMRKIVDYAIERGVLPILSTKGDNLEGDYRINQSIARVAYDDHIPMWNFWASIRDLPGKGIDGTRPGGYLIPDAWVRRSRTGLQALDAVWKSVRP